MDRKDRELEQQPGFKPKEEKGAGKYGPQKPHPGKDRDAGQTLEIEEEEEGGMDLKRPEGDLVRRPGDAGADRDAPKRSSGGFEDERSDRDSGRPVQLESEETGSDKHPGPDAQAEHGRRRRGEKRGEGRPSTSDSRADREPGLSGSQQEGKTKK